MKCNGCGYNIESTVKFCPHCGMPVPISNSKIVRCRKCNYDVDSNMKFCPECGEPVYKDNDKDKNIKYEDRDKERRKHKGDGDEDDDEGGILGSIGDLVGNIFGR